MNRRLCEVKNELISISVKLANEDRIPGWRYQVDDLRCPRGRHHCDPSQECSAWKDRGIRERVSKLENEIAAYGFYHNDETFSERSKP